MWFRFLIPSVGAHYFYEHINPQERCQGCVGRFQGTEVRMCILLQVPPCEVVMVSRPTPRGGVPPWRGDPPRGVRTDNQQGGFVSSDSLSLGVDRFVMK